MKKPGLSITDPASFRPISNLNTISKVLERLYLAWLVPHVAPSCILHHPVGIQEASFNEGSLEDRQRHIRGDRSWTYYHSYRPSSFHHFRHHTPFHPAEQARQLFRSNRPDAELFMVITDPSDTELGKVIPDRSDTELGKVIRDRSDSELGKVIRDR